jgi:uncharacterized phiE125 gp8 family phage protein
MAVRVVTPPSIEPITVAEAKMQTNIGSDADNDLLEIYISVAREHAEGLTGRSLAPQVVAVSLDSFPSGKIELPRGPVTEISAVKYIDINGVEQTLVSGTDYDEDTVSLMATIQPVYGGSWPDTKKIPNAVTVTYTAGYTKELCPMVVKQWLMIRVAGLHLQREDFVVGFSGQMVSKMPRSHADSMLDSITITGSL